MRGATWVSLLRRIPPALHEKLVIVTTTNTEVVVQSLLRLEREYVVVRGRMAGTQDTGRVIFVPYDQINFAGLTKVLTEPEVQGLLGKAGSAPAPEPAGEAPEAPDPADDEMGEVVDFLAEAAAAVEEPPPATPGPAPTAAEVARPDLPSKTALLARLRARLAGDRPRTAKP